MHARLQASYYNASSLSPPHCILGEEIMNLIQKMQAKQMLYFDTENNRKLEISHFNMSFFESS